MSTFPVFRGERALEAIMTPGIVVAIYLCPRVGQPLTPMPEVRAVPGQGLEGDRYPG
jgi:hypothetical protein